MIQALGCVAPPLPGRVPLGLRLAGTHGSRQLGAARWPTAARKAPTSSVLNASDRRPSTVPALPWHPATKQPPPAHL